MFVVIPVKPTPRNPQLHLALTLLGKHHPGTTVALIGHLPPLSIYPLNITHTPTTQGGDRFANTELAMRTALDDPTIPDPFTWSADDIYWTKPHPPVHWHQGELPTTPSPPFLYTTRKVHTRGILEQHGLPTLDYELHTPTLIHKQTMREALTLGGDMRTVHGNLQGGGTYHDDVKVRPGQPIPDAPFLSSARDTFDALHQALS